MKIRPLKSVTVVITGASSGIGRAAALAFAGHGAKLVLAARDKAALDEVVRQCESFGAHAMAMQTDVSDAAAVPALAEAAVGFGGRIDVWINNAGTGAVGAFDETPMQSHEQVVQIDLIGYMRGAHAVLPYFKRQQSGVLINVQSLGSWVPQPYAVAYSAAKFGLRGFSEALRGELSHFADVHICDLFPSFVDTPGMQHGANYSGGGVRPPPPMLDPREVAEALVAIAQYPRKATTIGAPTMLLRIVHALLPDYSRWSARGVEMAMRRAKPAAITDGALFAPTGDVRSIDGGWRAATSASLKPHLPLALGIVAAVSVGALLLRRATAHSRRGLTPEAGRTSR